MIEIEATHFASGRTRLKARYPDGTYVSWITFPGLLVVSDYVDVPAGLFHRVRVAWAARHLRRLGRRFWLDGQVEEVEVR